MGICLLFHMIFSCYYDCRRNFSIFLLAIVINLSKLTSKPIFQKAFCCYISAVNCGEDKPKKILATCLATGDGTGKNRIDKIYVSISLLVIVINLSKLTSKPIFQKVFCCHISAVNCGEDKPKKILATCLATGNGTCKKKKAHDVHMVCPQSLTHVLG
eukprot:TRINITY_DN4930_c0_g1_i5.p1 TRINITY_DN4930_c0_g1~~TRINITY_DN4930_c0_g1_i5.p1  ORF type:complete len:158 (-),score=24.91 TRINITY_DN4930_c0_g1_i5:320-793(-)